MIHDDHTEQYDVKDNPVAMTAPEPSTLENNREHHTIPAKLFRPLKRFLNLVFPSLDRDTLLISTGGMFFLVAYLHHGKSHHFREYFPFIYKQIDPYYAELVSYLYSHLAAFVILLIAPLLLALLLGFKPTDLGLSFRRCGREFLLVVVLLLLMTPIVWWASTTEGFMANYPKLKIIRSDIGLFIIYELIYLVKWISWEFFFRGFMLFGLAKRLGPIAIAAAMMPFVIAHLGKPELEVFGAIIAGLVLGKLSYSGKSIYPTVLLHFGVAFIMDFFSSLWWR